MSSFNRSLFVGFADPIKRSRQMDYDATSRSLVSYLGARLAVLFLARALMTIRSRMGSLLDSN